jgi:hypothetical protein
MKCDFHKCFLIEAVNVLSSEKTPLESDAL